MPVFTEGLERAGRQLCSIWTKITKRASSGHLVPATQEAERRGHLSSGIRGEFSPPGGTQTLKKYNSNWKLGLFCLWCMGSTLCESRENVLQLLKGANWLIRHRSFSIVLVFCCISLQERPDVCQPENTRNGEKEILTRFYSISFTSKLKNTLIFQLCDFAGDL